MNHLLATSYPGLFLIVVLFITIVPALPLGIVAVVCRMRKIAIGCGMIYVGFGAWTIVSMMGDESDDRWSVMTWGAAFVVVGLLFILIRRSAARSTEE